MLTIAQIRDKLVTLSLTPTQESYRRIAAMIHPVAVIAMQPDDFTNKLRLADDLLEFQEYRRHQQAITLSSWIDCVVDCALLWQYNTALLKLFPDLEEWKSN